MSLIHLSVFVFVAFMVLLSLNISPFFSVYCVLPSSVSAMGMD